MLAMYFMINSHSERCFFDIIFCDIHEYTLNCARITVRSYDLSRGWHQFSSFVFLVTQWQCTVHTAIHMNQYCSEDILSKWSHALISRLESRTKISAEKIHSPKLKMFIHTNLFVHAGISSNCGNCNCSHFNLNFESCNAFVAATINSRYHVHTTARAFTNKQNKFQMHRTK